MGGKSGGGAQTIGYRYFFMIHMGACRGPVDELVEIRVGDKSAWPYPDNEKGYTQGDFSELTEISVSPSTPMYAGISFNQLYPDEFTVYATYPQSWELNSWVKITNSLRRLEDGGDDLTMDGVYQVKYSGSSDILALSIHNEDQGFAVATFLQGIPPVDAPAMTFEHVADINGTPLPYNNTLPGAVYDRVTSSTTIQIQAGELFGGDKAEGGIEGPLMVLMGEPDQVAPAGLVEMAGTPQPGFRRVFTLLFDGLISSMNPYPKAWKFRIRRILKGWDGDVFMPEIATISMSRPVTDGEVTSVSDISAMNPAHIIFECLTNREWGRGLPRSALNVPSFEACARALFGEAFGLCIRWTRTDTIQSFIQGILDHITATLYNDPESALLTLRLIRNDYMVEDTPLFDPDNGLLEITDAPIASGGTYANEIKVTYHDPITNEDRQVRAHNLGSIQASGGSITSISKSYPGLPTPALASRVAIRDLRVLGLELRRFTFTVDRRGFAVRPGDVVRLRDPARNIPETLVRVATFGDGTLGNGKISITAVQDVFGLPRTSSVGQQPHGWVPPTSKPCIGRHEVFELPYALIARFTSAADLDYIPPEAGYLGTVLEEGQPLNAGYQLGVRIGAPTEDDVPTGTGYYCGYVPPTP